MVLASRRRVEAVAFANSLRSFRVPSSSSLTLRTSVRSKLVISPVSDAMTSEYASTGEDFSSVFLSAAVARFSTVRIEPDAVPFSEVTITLAPCSCDSTPASPPPAPSDCSDCGSMLNGISAVRADAGIDEL